MAKIILNDAFATSMFLGINNNSNSYIVSSGALNNNKPALFNYWQTTVSPTILHNTASSTYVQTNTLVSAYRSLKTFFYKGSVPTFASFTDQNTRADDLLLTLETPASNSSSSPINMVVGKTDTGVRFTFGEVTTSTAATGTGTATWFLMRNSQVTSTISAFPYTEGDLTKVVAILGTVGAVGSGADLEIIDPNIVTGQMYKSSGLTINFPYISQF